MAKKSNAGRPTAFTKVAADRIVQYLSVGGFVERACAFGGISKDTFYKWVARGERQKSGPLREFADGVKEALSKAEFRALLRINKGDPNWQSSAWFLERRFRSDWGRRLELSGVDGDPIRTESSVVVYLPSNDRDPLLDSGDDE